MHLPLFLYVKKGFIQKKKNLVFGARAVLGSLISSEENSADFWSVT